MASILSEQGRLRQGPILRTSGKLQSSVADGLACRETLLRTWIQARCAPKMSNRELDCRLLSVKCWHDVGALIKKIEGLQDEKDGVECGDGQIIELGCKHMKFGKSSTKICLRICANDTLFHNIGRKCSSLFTLKRSRLFFVFCFLFLAKFEPIDGRASSIFEGQEMGTYP